jgi:membrane protein implicated in regulation of membrane protease activity
LLQLPGLALVVLALLALQPLFDLSSRQVTAIIAIWVLKDAVLFPFVWRAFDWHRSDDAQVMVGTEALVVERLDPEGYVHVHGELWKAATMREGQPVEKGTIVYIRGMRGLTLIVE